MIMAESHASTAASLVGEPCVLGRELQSFHRHLNLVHCLSYGEPWMLPKVRLECLTPTIRRGIESGTQQFWRVMSALAGELDPGGVTDPLEEETLVTLFVSRLRPR